MHGNTNWMHAPGLPLFIVCVMHFPFQKFLRSNCYLAVCLQLSAVFQTKSPMTIPLHACAEAPRPVVFRTRRSVVKATILCGASDQFEFLVSLQKPAVF